MARCRPAAGTTVVHAIHAWRGSTEHSDPRLPLLLLSSVDSVVGRRRNLSEAGAVGFAGVSAAWMPRPSPHGRLYGVPREPDRPGHPGDSSTRPTTRGSAVRRPTPLPHARSARCADSACAPAPRHSAAAACDGTPRTHPVAAAARTATPWMGLRRVLPGHTHPTSPQLPSAALAVDVASAGAGRSPAGPHSPNISGRGRMIRPPCPVALSC